MSYEDVLGKQTIAISISDSSNMSALGLSDGHLIDAMAEIARHLLALGARLMYGGDLRKYGFSELIFELVARHQRDSAEGDRCADVMNFLAWPVHILLSATEIQSKFDDIDDRVELLCLQIDGTRLPLAERLKLPQQQPTEAEWSTGLTAMRRTMLTESDARIILGGRVDKYMGSMPGIAEEALISLQCKQPLYLMGGFGGCTREIAETIGLTQPRLKSHVTWRGRSEFTRFSADDLNNGLSAKENQVLAMTSHVDQAVMLILRGLTRVARQSD